MKAKILIINGSLGGAHGNTAQALDILLGQLADCDVEMIHLSLLTLATWPRSEIALKIQHADGFVFSTGTYWDSWGSPLQIFFEKTTELEASAAWLGKPAICLVTMHSVGGKGVLSRLQGVLSTLGLIIPPMSGMVYAMTSQNALVSPLRDPSFDADIWSLDDFEKMVGNFKAVLSARLAGHLKFDAWPVDARDPARTWFKPAQQRSNASTSLTVRDFNLAPAAKPRELASATWNDVLPAHWNSSDLGSAPIDLEIGCGVGLHPIQYCSQHPDRKLIAIEHTSAKFKTFASRVAHHPQLTNLLAVHADAIQWTAHLIPDQALSRIFILYPNPEPKASNKR